MDYSRYTKKYIPYLFMAPALILLIVFFFVPFFESFYISTLDYSKDIYSPTFIGAENYITLLKSPIFYKTMWNTIVYLVIAVPLLVILPLIIAIVINQKLFAINFYRVSIYLPVVVSIVVAGIAWKWLYADNGILNYFISLMGLPKIGWLTDSKYALYSVIAVTVWKGLGYYMMIYLAALTTVPKDLYEAADIECSAKTFSGYNSSHAACGCSRCNNQFYQRNEGFCRNIYYDTRRATIIKYDNSILYLPKSI